jgi:DNA ligase-1
MSNLPTLYKLTSTGAVQFWNIGVSHEADASYLVTRYGQYGTESPQETRDPIREGKNTGKANATSREQQAEAEALAKWEKQKKKGYVDSIDDAKAGKLDALIEGGIAPMLAHKFSEQGHKIMTPCLMQPKLDGVRCIAIIEDGSVTLWTRTRKPIRSVPHIAEALARRIPAPYDRVILDGELYNHYLAQNNDFERIVSMVRQDVPDPLAADLVQYHVYDMVSDRTTDHRMGLLSALIPDDADPLVLVRTDFVTEDQITDHFQLYRSMGYEGAMLRNLNGLYVNKRSYDLQKMKEFDDAEFDVIGIEEGRGKLVGHVGAFVCRMPNGNEFLAKMSGDTAKLREYYDNHALWQGKKLTVRYQGLTGKAGVPRFPVGVTMRDYE